MTNGEKIIEIFPNINIYEHGSTYSINNEYNFNASWWNAEYEEPTIKNDLGVDCISRAEVLKLMQDNWHTHNGDWAMEESMDDIRALQAVTPIRPKGHWIIKDGKEQGYDIGGVKTWYIQIMCSECGFIKTAIEGHTGQYHYCPNCGADMREVEE